MKRLNIGTTADGKPFTLELDTATLATATIGIRGSGKTSTAVVETEELLAAGQQVVIIDPTDVWWGLRSSHDGKEAAHAIPILGGAHGDIPLVPGMGPAIADYLVETRSPAILSVRHMRKGAQRQFVMELLEQLYHRKGDPKHKTALSLVIDEASQFVPQRVQGDTARLVGAVENCVRQGRSAGLGVVMIDQRPASVNKDVLSQSEMIIAHRVTGPQDRKALDEWVKEHDTEGRRADFLKALASLPNGTAWFWQPLADVFAMVAVRRRHTFDSSRTPKLGEEPPRADVRAEVDVKQLRHALQEALASAEADNPAALRGRIAELEAELAGKGPRVSVPVETAVVPVPDPPAPKVDALAWEGLSNLVGMSFVLMADLHEGKPVALHRIDGALRELRGDLPTAHARAREVKLILPDFPAGPVPQKAPAPPAVAELPAPRLRILGALATFAALGVHAVAKSNVAVFSDQSPTSSGFANNLGALRTQGLIDYPRPGFVSLTPAGAALAPAAERIATLRQLHDAWCKLLSTPQQAMLRILVATARGRSVHKDDLAQRTGQSPTSSGYANNLGFMRNSLGIIDYPEPKRVAATDLLFPQGLR